MKDRKIKIYLFSGFLLLLINGRAQNEYAAVTGGMLFSSPTFKNGYQAENWKGIYSRSHFLEFGFTFGEVNKDSLHPIVGNNFFVGANIPLTNLKLGHRHHGVRGILVQPFLGLDLGRTKVDQYKSWNLVAAPGLSIQMPFFVIDFRLNSQLNFRVKDNSALPRLAFTPMVSLQLDALYDVFDPNIQFDRTEYRTRVTDYTTIEQLEDKIIKTTTTTYEHYSVDVYVSDVQPFRYFGPRFIQRDPQFAGKTMLFGLGYGIRKASFGIDFIVDGGKLGHASSYEKAPTFSDPNNVGKINKDDSRYIGDMSCVRGLARILFDLNASETRATQFSRVMAGIGMGYAYLWNQRYYNTDNLKDLDAYLASDKEIFSTSAIDARKSKSGVFLHTALIYERGAISLGYEFNLNVNAELTRVNTFSIGYLIPYKRLPSMMTLAKIKRKHT